jgi:hypothetical protein
MLDHARTLIVGFCVCGPALYIGLLMLMDPAGFMISLRALAVALAGVLQTLDHRFRGLHWQTQLREPVADYVSPTVCFALRLAGLALAVYAVASLVEAATRSVSG